ncbi:DNA-directed RNA polymerase subunit beta', partial [Nitrospirota bacterium]
LFKQIVDFLTSILKEKADVAGAGKIFSSRSEVDYAYESGKLDIHAPITVRLEGEEGKIKTTCGRVLFSEILPKGIPFELVNAELTKKKISSVIDFVFKNAGKRDTVEFLDNLEQTGFKYATKSGISICINDMHIPSTKSTLIGDAETEVLEIQKQYSEGLITNGERYNKVIDIWANVTEKVAEEMMLELGVDEESSEKPTVEELLVKRNFNSVYMMADSGARGSAAQLRQLAGMRGLMAKPSGEIIETPITANFREGLSPLQYFISTHGARKGLADTALKTANSGYLTRRLVDVAQDVIVLEDDCKCHEGIVITPLVEGGEIIVGLDERLVGRHVAEEIKDPNTNKKIVKRNQLIDEEMAQKVVDAGVDSAKIRSVLTCQSPVGICAKCYGLDLARNVPVELGESIGIIAAQSIGEPGTQLTMRTFHIGGTASKVVEQTVLETKNAGFVSFDNLSTVRDRNGVYVVMSRNGSIAIQDAKGREKERYSVVYGAKLLVKNKEKISKGQKLVEWDPYSSPILTEVGGRIALGDIQEGVTVKEEVDETTGLSHKVIIDYPANMRPRISLKEEDGRATLKLKSTGSPASYFLPTGTHVLVDKGDIVSPGDVLAKIPRETTKTKDITGGLPRVAELFEARKPKEHAVVSEIDGIVEFKGSQKGMRVIHVKGGSDTREYLIPKGKHVSVFEGDWVRAGEPLMDGSVNPHSILDILGPNELQRYLVEEVQKVYRLQGVTINDKHIEVIVRQMMKKVMIEDPADTKFLMGEQVDRTLFQRENEKVKAEGGKPAQGKPLLLGITKASLSTDSFVSAASFQETTRVLTEAAINGDVDNLRGLKENVIMGRVVPSGTGMPRYRNTFVKREFLPHMAGSDMAAAEDAPVEEAPAE